MGVMVGGAADASGGGHGGGHGHGKGKGKGHHHHQHPLAVDGEFGFLGLGPPNSVIQEAPDLCLIELPATFAFEGDLEGSFASVFHIQHFGACDQPAPEYFETDGVWVGEVLGAEGSFGYSFEGDIDAQGNAHGDLTIQSPGTGECEGLEGVITLSGITGVGGTYSGQVEFD